MRLHRFFTKEDLQKGKEIRITDAVPLHQWTKVFRLSASDRIILFNGKGTDFEGYFKILSKKESVVMLDKQIKIENTPVCELHIFQSIIKKDNFELIVQKCTEIGATAFHPIITERSEKKDLNIERLEKIATEASEQSGRSAVPEIFAPETLEIALQKFDGKIFVLDLDGEPLHIKTKVGEKIGILIGPEGGWSENERDFFEHKKIQSFSFGQLVLRAETAAIVASALILLK